MAIAVARYIKEQVQDDETPVKGFGRSFCEQVRQVLNMPQFEGRVQCLTKGGDKSPSDKSIRNIWKSFMATGKPKRDTSQCGRKKKQDARDRVKVLMNTGDLSTRQLSSQANTSQTLVMRALKEKKNVFYRAPRGQKLIQKDCERRKKFASVIRHQISTKKISINDVCWTDEMSIGTQPNFNRQNTGFWWPKGKFDDWREKMVGHRQYEQKVHVFVVLHVKFGAIGPYFIEDINCPEDNERKTLTGLRYTHLLKHQVIPDLKSKLTQEEFDRCWWQQDGAPAHTSALPMNYLRSVFGKRIISSEKDEKDRDEHLDWPPYSPDLSSLD